MKTTSKCRTKQIKARFRALGIILANKYDVRLDSYDRRLIINRLSHVVKHELLGVSDGFIKNILNKDKKLQTI